MKSITKIEDAYLLPEKEIFGMKEEIQSDGTILRIPFCRDMIAVAFKDDTILVFGDKDGRMMTIEYDAEGAYKTPI